MADLHVPSNPVRIVTAGSLFDGHDAAINIMRRLLQSQGAEVIHLGHDRSVQEVVTAAIQEDAQGVAVSSYQGGHVEYFTYLRELLDSSGAGHIKVYGGGGGVIVAEEIELLHSRGVDRIFSPNDGQELGLPGMINTIIAACDVSLSAGEEPSARRNESHTTRSPVPFTGVRAPAKPMESTTEGRCLASSRSSAEWASRPKPTTAPMTCSCWPEASLGISRRVGAATSATGSATWRMMSSARAG